MGRAHRHPTIGCARRLPDFALDSMYITSIPSLAHSDTTGDTSRHLRGGRAVSAPRLGDRLSRSTRVAAIFAGFLTFFGSARASRAQAVATADRRAAIAPAAPDSQRREADSRLGFDSLVARALSASPIVHAAEARVDAVRARVAPASAPPDPMLMAGVVNQPLSRAQAAPATHGSPATTGGPDPMTMHMIGVEQTFPYPGKLALRRRAVEREVDAAQESLEAARRQV